MSPHALVTALGLVLAAAGFSAGAASGAPGEAGGVTPWTVTLANGRTYEGALVRLAAGRYLLQSGDTLLEVSEDEIDPRTFATRSRQDAIPERPVHEIRHYDEVHPDRTVTHWWTRSEVNDSRRAITEYRFGLAPWEQLVAGQREYRDWLGNVLVPEYDPPRGAWRNPPEGRVQVSMRLPVPVAPGEGWSITGSETVPWVQSGESGLVYRFAGDYAEDNLVWLKVRLPQGAKVVSVTPQPSARFSADGSEYVMWRRYYKQGEKVPLEIVYKLD